MAAQFTQDQIDFASVVSKETGADFFTILGWEKAEGGPPDNPLNIGPGQHFASPVVGAEATASLLEKSNYYQDILSSFQTKYATDTSAIASQAYAIAYNEHWNVIDPRTHTPAATSRLRQQYLQNIESNAIAAAAAKLKPNSKIQTHQVFPGGPNYPDKGSGLGIPNPLSGITGAITNLAEAIAAPFQWLGNNWDRILFVLGGAILAIIAIIVIVKSRG